CERDAGAPGVPGARYTVYEPPPGPSGSDVRSGRCDFAPPSSLLSPSRSRPAPPLVAGDRPSPNPPPLTQVPMSRRRHHAPATAATAAWTPRSTPRVKSPPTSPPPTPVTPTAPPIRAP